MGTGLTVYMVKQRTLAKLQTEGNKRAGRGLLSLVTKLGTEPIALLDELTL